LAPLAWLAPARSDGAGAAAGRLDGAHLVAAALSVVAVALATGLWSLGVVRALFACVLAAGSAWGLCAIARRQIGGQTGDVAGAAGQFSELSSLCALLIGGRGA
jgi:adenosylcobinamide-GDP ribazoletransferase